MFHRFASAILQHITYPLQALFLSCEFSDIETEIKEAKHKTPFYILLKKSKNVHFSSLNLLFVKLFNYFCPSVLKITNT